MESQGLPQFNSEWFIAQLFWLAVCLSVLYFALARVFLPKLNAVMQARTNQREGDITQAKSMQQSAEDARVTYERAQADARAKAQALMAEAAHAMKQQSEAAIAQVEQAIELKAQEASKAIAAKKAALFKELESGSADLVQAMLVKVAQQEISRATALEALARMRPAA